MEPTAMGLTRDDLVSICEDAIVPMNEWTNRDSAMAHEQLGRAWALLRAGCPFTVRTEPRHERDSCVTNDETIWVAVEWEGFSFYEGGRLHRETFYLPTRQRLAERSGRDWY